MEDRIEVGEYVRTKNGEIGVFDRYSSRKENSLYKSLFNCFIKIRNRKTPLQCCEDNCCFNVTERQTVDLADVLYKDNEDLEVIGNIYDNPELLGVKDGI